jgi:TPR repeat protein
VERDPVEAIEVLSVVLADVRWFLPAILVWRWLWSLGYRVRYDTPGKKHMHETYLFCSTTCFSMLCDRIRAGCPTVIRKGNALATKVEELLSAPNGPCGADRNNKTHFLALWQYFGRADHGSAVAMLAPLAAADVRHPDALFALGVAYHRGEGVVEHQGKAVELWTEASELGHTAAMNAAATAITRADDKCNASGLVKDMPAALALFREASDKGNPLATANLAACYMQGRGVTPNIDVTIELLTKASQEGEPCAMLHLAAQLLTMEANAAKHGTTSPAARLVAKRIAPEGQACDISTGTSDAVRCAVVLCLQSADAGLPQAIATVAGLFISGRHGVCKDARQALKLLQRSADLGHPQSQQYLQRMRQVSEPAPALAPIVVLACGPPH